MKIERLVINKYKSINSPFILKQTGKLHFFIGANNSGKTNILDAITQIYQENDVRLLDNKTNLRIDFSLTSKFGKKLHVVQKKQQRDFFLDNKKIDLKKAEKILSHHIIRLSATKEISLSKIKNDYKSFKLKYKNQFVIFRNTLKKYIPKIQLTNDFLSSEQIKDENVLRSFSRLGNGFQQAFKILMYLFHPQYTILLLEEPEIHLHPALVKKLLRIFQKENLYNQIFLTTHSPLFIHTDNLHRLFRVTKEQGGTRVYSPRLIGKRLNYARLIQELNADNCEMFFADKVLLVEGPSDHILMRGLIDRFYKGEKNIKVIQTFGKSNIDIYVDVLKMFNIPYQILLDLDALYDTGIKLVQSQVAGKLAQPEPVLIKMLKEFNIFILSNGSIERNYPKKYQRRRKHKPQNALYAANNIKMSDYKSTVMKDLKEVIDNL